MADSFNINLAECAFGPDELNWIIKEWLKDPKPKTVIEIARIYLTNWIKNETGYFPYDRRNQYQKGDTIIVKPIGGEICLAQIVEVIKKSGRDSDGFPWDEIDLILLDAIKYDQKKPFISNYQGKENAGPAVTSLQIIKEKDEFEVIPKILLAFSNDDRFVAYQESWLPTELLKNDIRQNCDKIREVIAASKHALSTKEILEKLEIERENGCLNSCLEFSVNYFLKQDRRFDEKPGDITRWDLRKPPSLIQITIDKRKLCYNRFLEVPLPLDLLLFYHGFIKRCVFVFPYGRLATTDYDNARRLLSGEELTRELGKISDDEQFKIKFGQPEQRGGPIPVFVLTPEGIEEKGQVQSTVTIREDWVEKGILVVPKKISNYMDGTNTVRIIYDQTKEVLPYEEEDKIIEGLKSFYSIKAVAEFDKVHLRLEGLDPTRLFISSTWQKSLDKLLSIEPQDLDWEHSSLRDCIIVTLANFKAPAHYREIYAEIAQHKNVSLSGVGAKLSRYSPSVFTHIGWGKWQLAGFPVEEVSEVENVTNEHSKIIPEPPDEETWKAVQLIEENDYVYKLLEKVGSPLSFNDICNKIATLLKIDEDKLKATGFLNPNDKRLRRLDNGEWALEEWYKKPSPVSEKETVPVLNEDADDSGVSPEITEKPGISKLFWVILIIVLFLITIAIVVLFWLFL